MLNDSILVNARRYNIYFSIKYIWLLRLQRQLQYMFSYRTFMFSSLSPRHSIYFVFIAMKYDFCHFFGVEMVFLSAEMFCKQDELAFLFLFSLKFFVVQVFSIGVAAMSLLPICASFVANTAKSASKAEHGIRPLLSQ